MEPRNKEINECEERDIIGTEPIEPEAQPESPQGNFFERLLKSGLFTKGFSALIFAFLFSIAVYILSRFVPSFAEFWTRHPAHWMRFILAKITGWIPFSLAECILVALPLIAIAYIIASTVSTKRDDSPANFYRWLRPLISTILVIATLFFAAFGPAYGRNTLAKNLGLDQNAVSAVELFDTSVKVTEQLNGVLSEVAFDTQGSSVMPYDYDELVTKVNAAFDKYAESVEYINHFKSYPKPIALSEPMTYTHISGVYTFMTGESNINTNYPDFLMPFTMAHEMAHQRGIAREDEANFVAFLVCINSDDAYIRYSGYSNMVNYLNSALYSADKDLYAQFRTKYLPSQLSAEFIAYSLFFDKYRDSTASAVTGTVNNAFLQSQGQAAGTKSYGLVVDLAVAYYK